MGDQRRNWREHGMSSDNVELYENIGDIVISRAHAGDKECFRIFELALQKTENLVQEPEKCC
jgi:hypothetical protein